MTSLLNILILAFLVAAWFWFWKKQKEHMQEECDKYLNKKTQTNHEQESESASENQESPEHSDETESRQVLERQNLEPCHKASVEEVKKDEHNKIESK